MSKGWRVIGTIVVILAAWTVIVNYAADMINHWMDPRLRAE